MHTFYKDLTLGGTNIDITSLILKKLHYTSVSGEIQLVTLSSLFFNGTLI